MLETDGGFDWAMVVTVTSLNLLVVNKSHACTLCAAAFASQQPRSVHVLPSSSNSSVMFSCCVFMCIPIYTTKKTRKSRIVKFAQPVGSLTFRDRATIEFYCSKSGTNTYIERPYRIHSRTGTTSLGRCTTHHASGHVPSACSINDSSMACMDWTHSERQAAGRLLRAWHTRINIHHVSSALKICVFSLPKIGFSFV